MIMLSITTCMFVSFLPDTKIIVVAPTVLLKLIGNVIYSPYPVIEIPIICADCSIGILKSVLHFEGIMI
jgi:hypothetical protein